MKIINLADDRKRDNGLLREHGLSFYMETEHKKYLFDAGASDYFIKNSNALGINLKDTDALFISHNHYDHIGGLKYFMEVNKKAKIYIKEDAVNETYYKRQYIECPLGKYYDELGTMDRVIFVKDNLQVDDIYLVTDTNGNKDFFCQGTQFYKKVNGVEVHDDFSHEMFLVYVKDGKSNIFSACSHRGIINIIETTKSKFNLPINYVVGGLHLSKLAGKDINCTEEYYFNLVDYLKDEDISQIYTCHCTGKFAYELLRRDLKNKINYFGLGDELNL